MACCGEEENDSEVPNKTTNKQRTCTDVFWLAIFILFWLFMILIAAFAIVYGNPLRLINGYDSFGNTCGVRKNEKIGELAYSGYDTSDKPYLFYLDVTNLEKSLQICVKQCPDRNLNTLRDVQAFYNRTGSSLCSYYFNMTIDENVLKTEEEIGSFSRSIGPCPALPVYASSSVLHRCVPKPVEGALKQFTGSIYKILNQWETLEQILSDIYDTWDVIIALCFLAFVLSLFMVAVLHFVASFVAWIFMIAVSIACIIGTGVLWWTYCEIKWSVNESLDKSVHNETAFLVYSIIATIFTIIILLLVYAMRNRISFLAKLFRESSECLGDLPYLFVQPFVTFAVLLLFFAFWVTVMVCLATATYPGSKNFSAFDESQITPINNAFVAHTSGQNTSPIANISSKDLKTYKLIQFVDASWIRSMWWVYLIGLIWTSEFILSCQQMVIAGAVAIWYFDGKRKSDITPIRTSVTNMLSYHLGSIALGSLLITILKIPRLILTYTYAKLKQNEETSECAKCGLKCCICCFYCLEKCVRFMNHNAYTVIAMQGINFCSAARRAFSILVNNALQLATVNSVGDFILFLGKCFVTAATGSIGLLILKRDPTLKFYAAPTLLVAIFAFLIAHSVLSLYEIVIDTLFLCICEDKDINGEAGRWKETEIGQFDQKIANEQEFQQHERQNVNKTPGRDETDERPPEGQGDGATQDAELTPIRDE